MVPLDNSVKGILPATIEELVLHEGQLRFGAEVHLPVTLHLMMRPGTSLRDVTSVLSYPHGHAQCRKWLAQHLPYAETVFATSTAAAARAVTENLAPGTAAIASSAAAVSYGVTVVVSDLGEPDHAVTRFIAVTCHGTATPRTGDNRTTLVVGGRTRPPRPRQHPAAGLLPLCQSNRHSILADWIGTGQLLLLPGHPGAHG